MKDQINKFFHTDKWWGKTVFILLTYVIFWCVFYGSWFLVPDSDHNSDINAILPIILFLGLIPLLSFFIPYFIKKLFTINKAFLYFLHILILLISTALFFLLLAMSAFSHGFIF